MRHWLMPQIASDVRSSPPNDKTALRSKSQFQNLSASRISLPGSSHVRHVGLETAGDQDVWRFARDEHFVMVTKDADFAEIAIHRGSPPKVIRLRIGNRSTSFIVAKPRKNSPAIERFVADDELHLLELV